MAKAINVIQLPGGILLSKTASVGELLARINKKNVFLAKDGESEYSWITILPDAECHWDWSNGNVKVRSQTGNSAFLRQGDGNRINLATCLDGLVKTSATVSPEKFIPTIEQLGEKEIIQELTRLVILYGR
ncbi:MAG: hypothetical protein Q8N37_03185 [bacterium]|nr:hypothetical protein [bacterium]